jgi:indolepyruvate ferredoxin oxidoreductase
MATARRATARYLSGYPPQRRQERQLIADYEALVRGLLPKLGRLNYDTAVKLAAIPEQIRGFGHVKDKSVREAKAAQERLLQDFHRGDAVPSTRPRNADA